MAEPEPISRKTRTTWRTHVRHIAEVLDIPVKPHQYVVIESAEDDGGSALLSGFIDIVRWEEHQ